MLPNISEAIIQKVTLIKNPCCHTQLLKLNEQLCVISPVSLTLSCTDAQKSTNCLKHMVHETADEQLLYLQCPRPGEDGRHVCRQTFPPGPSALKQ